MADNYLGEDDDVFSDDGEYGGGMDDNYGVVRNPYKEGYGNVSVLDDNNYSSDDDDDDGYGGNYQLEDDVGGNYDLDEGAVEEKPKKRIDTDGPRALTSEEKAELRYETELTELINLRLESESPFARLHQTLKDFSNFDSGENFGANWTEAYQKLISETDSYSKFLNIAKLARDFNYAADIYGKIIINELCLSNDKKSIKPVSIGGIAGGSKYIISGILFKFALDVFGLYGYNDDGAMKAAAHELRGVIQINSANIPNLHTPLMCLIDYKGFRLIAMSLIDIDDTTLVYGSADGGKMVHNSSDGASSAVKLLAQRLNLKKHVCGLEKLFICCDCEVHQVKNSYYVIDSARLFPPEAKEKGTVSADKGDWLYRLLRPELVKSNPVPLSSDAFSNFQRFDPDKIIHNNEVREATARLHESAIPTLVTQLEKIKSEELYKQNLGKIFHSCGVNLRKLGVVRSRVKSASVLQYLLCYMIIRSCKVLVQLQMRNTMWKLEVPRDEIFKEIHLNLLNNLFGNKDPAKSEAFWASLSHLIIERYGEGALQLEEQTSLFNVNPLRGTVNNLNLFRVWKSCFPSVVITKELNDIIRYESNDDLLNIVFAPGDIVELRSVVKQTNTTYYAEAMALKILSESKGVSKDAVERLNKRAAHLLSFAVNVSNDSDSLVQSGIHNYEREKYEKALSDLEAANQVNKKNCKVLMYLGLVLANSNKKNYPEAAKYWEQAALIDPSCLDPYLTFSRSFTPRYTQFHKEDINSLFQILFHSPTLCALLIQKNPLKEVDITIINTIDDKIFGQLFAQGIFNSTEKMVLAGTRLTSKSISLLSSLTHLLHLNLNRLKNIPLNVILQLPKSLTTLILPDGDFDVSSLESHFLSTPDNRKFIYSSMSYTLLSAPSTNLIYSNHPNPSLFYTREDKTEVGALSPKFTVLSTITEFHKEEDAKYLLQHKENDSWYYGIVKYQIFLFQFDTKTATKVVLTPHKAEIKIFNYMEGIFRTFDEKGLMVEWDENFQEVNRLTLKDVTHPSHTMEDIAITPTHFIVGSFGSPSLLIFDRKGVLERTISIKGGEFISNILAAEGKIFCRCIADIGPNLFQIFDIATGNLLKNIVIPDCWQMTPFLVDDQLLYVSARDSQLLVYDINGEGPIHSIDKCVGNAIKIFTHNGLLFASTSLSFLYSSLSNASIYVSFLHQIELHRLCAIGTPQQVLAELTLHPFDLNATDFRGYTALHYAALRGNMEILSILVDAKVNPHLRTRSNKTALDYAKERIESNSIYSAVPDRWVPVVSLLESYISS